MSSFETSSPVSASTLAYLMRWPVLRLIWLKLIFSESEADGYKATGQLTSERRRKPFQLARGAIQILQNATEPESKTILPHWFRHSIGTFLWRHTISSRLPFCSLYVLNWLSGVGRCSPPPCALKSNIGAAKSTGSA